MRVMGTILVLCLVGAVLAFLAGVVSYGQTGSPKRRRASMQKMLPTS